MASASTHPPKTSVPSTQLTFWHALILDRVSAMSCAHSSCGGYSGIVVSDTSTNQALSGERAAASNSRLSAVISVCVPHMVTTLRSISVPAKREEREYPPKLGGAWV